MELVFDLFVMILRIFMVMFLFGFSFFVGKSLWKHINKRLFGEKPVGSVTLELALGESISNKPGDKLS